MTLILIRADASLSIGSGHVMRCRTLARELQRRGAAITFLCRRQPGDLITLLEQEFPVLALRELSHVVPHGLQGREVYGAWLGCSQEQDADDCLRALRQAGLQSSGWLVVDHYGLDAQWQAQLIDGLGQPKLLVIDDLADRPHLSDLLLDQNFFGSETEFRYQSLVPKTCRQLLGPHYALLSPDYAQLHPLVPPRSELRRVLVFFGGVDPDNLTIRALEALEDPELSDLAVDVVLGLQSPHRQVVAERVARRPNTTLHAPLTSLAGLIARADLAIGACGATTWERACLGLPSLVVAIADNQLPFAKVLDQAGKVDLLGSAAAVSAEQIRRALIAALQELRPCGSGQDLTDGWGAGRVGTAMMGLQPSLHLRLTTESDEALLLRWANDPQVRPDSRSPQPIAPELHHLWFQASRVDANRLLLIASDPSGCPLGQINFERQQLYSSHQHNNVLMSFTLDRCLQGLGLEAEVVHLGLHAVEQAWGLGSDLTDRIIGHDLVIPAPFVKAGESVGSLINTDSSYTNSSDASALKPSRITLISDSGSWINPFLPKLIIALWQRGHAVRWIHKPSQLLPGDICLLLSCGQLLGSEHLRMHRHNLVVHESDLPHGKGWSPMTWQILEGSNLIVVTLFEATEELDAGPIYLKHHIHLQGHELVDEWRAAQAMATYEICLYWFDQYREVTSSAFSQKGSSSKYQRRKPEDSMLDPMRTLAEQFNLLRVVDNSRYPSFFRWKGRKYEMQINLYHDVFGKY